MIPWPESPCGRSAGTGRTSSRDAVADAATERDRCSARPPKRPRRRLPAAAQAPRRLRRPAPVAARRGGSGVPRAVRRGSARERHAPQRLFPRWEQNPLDAEALRDVRRAFHTLKGSGRMVGARRIGEFSWSIETLLNRVISQTLTRSPEIVAVVRDAVAVMPQLVDEIDGGVTTSDGATQSWRARTRCPAATPRRCRRLRRHRRRRSKHPDPGTAILRASRPRAAGRRRPRPPTPLRCPKRRQIAAEVSTGQASARARGRPAEYSTMDPVLREIFRKETAGHILRRARVHRARRA